MSEFIGYFFHFFMIAYGLFVILGAAQSARFGDREKEDKVLGHAILGSILVAYGASLLLYFILERLGS